MVDHLPLLGATLRPLFHLYFPHRDSCMVMTSLVAPRGINTAIAPRCGSLAQGGYSGAGARRPVHNTLVNRSGRQESAERSEWQLVTEECVNFIGVRSVLCLLQFLLCFMSRSSSHQSNSSQMSDSEACAENSGRMDEEQLSANSERGMLRQFLDRLRLWPAADEPENRQTRDINESASLPAAAEGDSAKSSPLAAETASSGQADVSTALTEAFVSSRGGDPSPPRNDGNGYARDGRQQQLSDETPSPPSPQARSSTEKEHEEKTTSHDSPQHPITHAQQKPTQASSESNGARKGTGRAGRAKRGAERGHKSTVANDAVTSQASTQRHKGKKPSMRTAHDVISRIQWDRNLPEDYFDIGYLDR